MRQVIRLNENELRRIVMEASARILDPSDKYDEFDKYGFDAEGDEKQAQIDSSWDALKNGINDDSAYDRNMNIEDNGLDGYYGLLSQGYDSYKKQEASPGRIMFGQADRGSVRDSLEAQRANWFAAPNDEDFGDGMPPIIGQSPNRNGKFATRNRFSGQYNSNPENNSALDESIKRAVRKTVKKYVR